MTVVTPPSSSDGDSQQQPQSPSNSPFEWKTLVETLNDNTNSTKYNELIQSILRWEDLLTRPDPINEQFLNSFVIIATYHLVGGLTRVERSYFTDVINVGKLLLKYLLQNLLPKTTETNRLLTLNAIKSLCYCQTFLSSSELKDSFEVIKNFDGPQINKEDRRLRSSSKTLITRRETGLVDSLCNTGLFDFSSSEDISNGNKRDRPHSAGSTTKLTFSKHMSQVLLTYFKQLHGEQSFSEIFFHMPLLNDTNIHINDILHKDINIIENNHPQFRENLSTIKNNLDFLRRAFQLPIIEPLDEYRLNKFILIIINSLRIAFQYIQLEINNDEIITNDQILHDIARICIKLGDIIRYSPRLENSRNIFFNYQLLLAVLLTKGIQQILKNNQQNETQQTKLSINNLLIHLVAILMFSTREIINDLSYSDSNIQTIDIHSEKFTLTSLLQSSQRYYYLEKNQTLKLFLIILRRLTLPIQIKPSVIIPDAPPLPTDLLITEKDGEDDYYIRDLFTEPILTNTSTTQQTVHRSLSSSTNRKRTILNRCLDVDLCSDDYYEQDDYYDLLNYLDKNYFNENFPIVINDLKITLNTNEQIENLSNLIQHSIVLPRFIHNILQNDILTHDNENILLEKLGVSFEQTWPLKISLNTLIILLKIILKRKNNELIYNLWKKFLQSISNTSDELTLEHLQIFLIFFHQLTMQERKNILLELVQIIQITKQNSYLLNLFEYIMFNFYEIPAEIIENIQQIISKNDITSTTNFNQIISKNNSNYLDGFALNTLYNNPIYNKFYDYLIEQLDFTKINKDNLSNPILKQYYDILWRILGYLPPSNEFLENMPNHTKTTHLLHMFRLEKKILHDKHITDFLSKEISFKNIEWFTNINKHSSTLFDLIVYQILLQNLTSTSDEINHLYQIFINQLKSSLNINPYLESLSIIPITKVAEDKTKTITIPNIPQDFEELFKYQLNYSLEHDNLQYIYLREILQILLTINSEIDNKQLYIDIQLNTNLQFLKEQIKFKNLNNDTFNNDMCEYIYKNIFEILFNKNFPNDIITEDIYHDLIKYLDEQFQVNIFQNCLSPYTLFDLLYLTSKENLSITIFARMLMLFNKIFSYSNQFQLSIQSLNRIADLTNEQLSQWLAKLVLPQNIDNNNQIYTPEQCKHILETFIKYLIKKNDDGTNMISEEVSLSILSVLIQLGNELLKPNKYALGFSQIIQLLVILAGHGSGNGHTYLFQAAAIWLEFCADALVEDNKDSTPPSFLSSIVSTSNQSLSFFHSNILEASVYLLAYINDILIALKHLSTPDSPSLKSPFKSDESEDDDNDSQDDEDISFDSKKTFISSTNSANYDPNKLCTFTTTKKEYANQHWYHCHTCKMVDRVGICQICANVCHKDHDISYAKYGSFFCDCGAKDDGSCQALAKRSNTTNFQPLTPTSLLKRKKIKKPTTSSTLNKKTKLTNRQRRLIRQINSKQQDYHSCIQSNHIPSNALRLFKLLQPYINNEYQQIYNIENKFDLINEFLKSNQQQLSLDNDDNKQQQQQLFTGILHSQENAFEHVKLSFTNEHGQQIKQLLSTNSIRRQGMCIMSSINSDQTKQHLIVSQEKGKQAMITVLQLNSLLKQTTTMINNVSNDNSTKKKFTLNKLNTFNIPFTILSMQPNQLNSDYLCITGLKDCHILNIDINGRLKEPTIILQPNLDSTGNYIIRAQWLSDKNQSQLALLTADFIKIYDLSIDTVNPIYYFILPTGKVRDCTFYYTKRNNIECCYILIMASNGYIYYEQLSESSSARNGSFYVTNTLDIKHETITETNNNGILLGGGVSVYFSSTLKLLFWSYAHGKNFYGIIDEVNIEKLLMIRSIDVKMTPTTSTNGSNKSTLTYHTLCSWSEIAHHPGLIYTMTQMTNNPVVLMLTPSSVRISEIKMQIKTTKIQDIVALRYDQRTTFILLADDGSLKILLAELDKTNYWLNKFYQKKKYFPMIDLDLNEDHFDYENLSHQYSLSDNETDEQQEPIVKRRKQTITTINPSINNQTNELSNDSIKFPVDFFETCHLLTEYEFGGRDLLDVYNVAQLKLRLSTPGMFIANVRTGGFTLEVINKDSDNMVITGIRIHIGSYSLDKSPQYFELFGRTIHINNLQGPRWYDLCLTREESIQAEKKFNIFIAQSIDTNHITVIDDVKVYGKTKEEFQWPDDVDASLLASTANTGVISTTAANGYLHSFRQTNDEKELATLSLTDRLLVYSMQVLTSSLCLRYNFDEQNRLKLNSDIVQSTSDMFHMSLPPQIQRYSHQLLKEFFSSISSSDLDYYEHIDRLQLSFLSQCFSSKNYLELFNDINTYEYLLLSLLSITRHRPHNINRFLNITQNESKDVISKSASMEIFIPYLINIFFNLLNQRPSNPLLESIDNKTIDLKQIKKLLHILVDIYHSLALNEPQICMNLIVESYIRLLTYHDYQINFIIKNALNRCMQPKIQRLISKLSTASDLNQQDLSEHKFHSMPLSAQIYPTDEQTRPRWRETTTGTITTITPTTIPTSSSTTPPPPPPTTTTNDETAMLQYALALSMSENPDPTSSTSANLPQAIDYVDNDDENPPIQNDVEMRQMMELMVNAAVIDNPQATNSDNNSLYEGDDGHVSESSSTTNDGGEQTNKTTSTPKQQPPPPPPSSSSNDSNSTIKLNINESIDSGVYEQRLYELKHLIVEKLLDNLDEYLLNNSTLNGLNSIAYLQLLLTLTIEFASKSDENNQQFVHYILKSLLRQMTFIKENNENLIKRTSQHEIQLMLLRLFTVYVSFMLKVRFNEREQYIHLSLTAAKQLDESNVVNYCLFALKIVYNYLVKQPIDENLLNEQTILSPSGTTLTTTTNTQTSSSSATTMTLLKSGNQQVLPDLSPFFYKQYTKHHANDVFEAYPELLAEIATRLPYQMKKVFDCTSESRPFLLSSDWQKCLCEYYVLPQASFLKRQIRKLLMYICGSRDKYRKLRDLHVLSTNINEIKKIYEESFSFINNDQRKTISTQIPYVTLMRLVDHLKSCQDISLQRCSNWQKFCKNDSSILHFLIQLIMLVDDSLVPFILHLLINSISSSSNATSSSSSSSRTLKTSKSVRPNEFDSADDLSVCSIALQFSKIISHKLLEDFIRLFLLENNQQSIRWLTHTFLYNLYINSNKQLQDHIFDLLINLWSTISHYGLKSFQYIDLLGFIIIKNKDDKRTNEFLPKLELMLKTENQLLLNHPNASIYRRLSTIIDIEQNNGYYFETEPCLVCNNPDIPYQQVKLQTIKLDQRYTTQSHIIKLIQAYSIQKLHIKMSEVKRNKAVRTIRFYYNNRHVQSIVDLKNSVNCKWLLAKTIKLTNIQQTEVKVDFIIPIIACNLMIEYVDFFETPTASLPTVTDTTTLQCPRCNSAVAATPGICPNCGENVFQCHKCRSINYDERDPFLCNSCGYCKYCKFDFIFTAKQVNYVEPIESDEDRAKTITNISQLLEKTDKIYRQLINQKPILEFLLTKLTSDDQGSPVIPSLPTATPTPSTTTATTGDTNEQQQQTPTVPTPTVTLTSTNNLNGINRIVQQIAPKYNTECRQTYDELGKYIQKIICARKELYTYDQRHSNLSSSSTTTINTFSTSHNCYGCTLSTISHCILLLRAFASSSNRLKQSITNNIPLIDELLLNNIRYTNQQIRHDVRLLFCYLTRDNSQLTDYITTKICLKIETIFQQKIFLSSSLINYDLLVLYSLIQRSNQDDQDLCWENKLRCIVKLFLHSLRLSTPQILEIITLPCLRMLLHLSKPINTTTTTTNNNNTKLVSIDIEKFLSKQITYHDFNTIQDKTTINSSRINNSWLETLIFCSQSATIRYLTCKLIQTLCTNEKQKFFIIQILMNYLPMICNENLSKYSYEYVQLIKDLLLNDNQLKLLLSNDEHFNIIKQLAFLIENQIDLINKQDERNLSNSNLTFGYSIKCLIELLYLFLQQDELKQKYKSILIAIVLNGYLTLKKLIVQRTKLIDEAQNKMLELLEQMTRGNEQETRQFMIICIDTIEKFQLDDMQTPLFIFERLCNLIYPEETMQGNKEFFIVVEKDPNQEDFLQGRMMGNPYSSADPAMGPLMRDIKNKICTDCELIALLEDDNGMELLVANKIINLGLSVRDVYKKVWLPYINSHQTTPSSGDPSLGGAQPIVNSSQNEHEPMHIIYRMRGLLGDATEDIIETFDTKKNAGENGEDDPEDIYRLANVLSEHSGLETMLKRLDSISDMSSGKALLQILLKLFEYAIKLKVNRQRLIDPKLRAISSMLNKLNLLLKTEIEEQGRDQALLSLTEKLLYIMDQLFHEASTTLSQDKYNEFSVSCEGDIEQLRSLLNYIKLSFVKSHPSLMEALIHLLPYLSFGNKEKMQTLLDYFKTYLEFDRFDLEQVSTATSSPSNDNDSQLHLDCFCEVCKHLDKKSIYGKEFRDLVNESNGIIDQCINYIETNSPQVKTYLGMQDQDSWKEFLNKPSLSYVLRLLTGLSYGHENIQMKIGQSLIRILHKIEQLTTAGKVGVLAEDLLHSLTENEQVAKKIDDVRNQTRTEKKRLAQEARDRKMRELNLIKTRNKSVSESSATASKIPVAAANVDLTEETGHVCCICREGYKYFPNKVLAIYTFTKKVDIEPFEGKTRKTSGYATVTHFNIIHIECHTSAIKQARSRDEWESALLQNANTRCNGLLPLWGPDVAETQFTTALARYDTNIIEATGVRETSPTLSLHDIKLLLIRFADVQSFSEDTGGGGRESNIRLIPYEMHAILYVLTTSRQIEREEKLLQNFLSRPDSTLNEAFEVDGPFFMTTLALIIMKPSDWEKNRLTFLQKLLLTAHIRSTHTPNDRTKIASKALKPFAIYKTSLIFFGLVNAFFVHMLKPRLDTISTTPYNQQLAQFLRNNDAFIMEACTKILKHFEQDLLSSQTFETLFTALDCKQLSEQWIQDVMNTLP
ncbi:unnamed protein product [Adineta steineri]|uniref:UBR-type domain-containing protein n=1 Tax=Adineta steineri TaxID=433720 RepID=A0A818PWN5_9BILA|nr:unnamed protein product [Adineta steineri]